MPVSWRNPQACGWDEGEEEQTWRIKGFQAWSGSCIPPCLSLLLLMSHSRLLSLPPPSIHLHFLFLQPQWGCQMGSLMFPWCRGLRMPVLAKLSVCTVPVVHLSSHTGANSNNFIWLILLWVMYYLFSLHQSSVRACLNKSTAPFTASC